jgi:phage-related protein
LADVYGEAVVEIIPDVKNFGKNLNKQLNGVTDDISKSVKDIDKEFDSIGGSLDDSFKTATKAVVKDFDDLKAQMLKIGLQAEADLKRSANNSETNWRIAGDGIEGIFGDVMSAGNKSAKEVEKEFARAAKATEKAFANSAKLAEKEAKEIEKSFVRAAKATEKALANSAKLAEKEAKEAQREFKKMADEAEKAAKAASDGGKDADHSFASLAGRLSSVTGLLTKVVTTGASLGSIIPLVVALASTLAQASGAALILPGAIASIGLAGATLKLAFTGIGDALSADNAKELEAAMANLPSTAQEFVKALRNVKDEFEGVRRGVQSAFFAGLDAKIDQLGSALLPIVTRGLVGISKELNTTAKSFADMLLEGENVKAIDAIFDATRTTVHNLGEALAPIGQVLLDIVQVGSEAFADLTAGVGSATQKFADFIREMKESGKLRDIIDGGIQAFKILGGLLADIAAIVKNVFGPLIDGAGALGTPLNAVLNTFREFTSQQSFIDMMHDLGEIVGQLAHAVGDVLGAALDAVMPTLQKLIELIGDHLRKVLPTVVPFIEKLVGFFGDLLFALTPLLDPLFKLVQQLLPPMAELIGRIIDTIDINKVSLLATTLGESLSKAVTDLMPHIIEFADKLGDLFVKMGPTIDTFLDFAIRALPIVVAGLGWLAGFILDFISFCLDPLILAWQAVSWVVRETWEAAKNWIVLKIAEILGGIETLKEIPGKVGEFFSQMRQAAVDKIAELANAVREIPGKILGALGNIGSLLWDAGARVIGGFIDGLKSRVGEIAKILGGITSSIPSLKGPPVVDSKLLTPNGQLIMQGLVAGFEKGEKGVEAHLRSLTSSIANQMDMSQSANRAANSVNNMTSKLSPGGAITQSAIAQSAATQAAINTQMNAGDANVDVTVVLGDEVLNNLVTNIVVDRDKRTKRAVTAGGRRTP